MTLSASEQLVSIVSHLGGPKVTSGDIEWATDLPAGKKLIDWLASQVDDSEDVDYKTHASLRDIALEREEISS